MDCWLYDELLVVDEDTLSHEILFGSGAKLLLHNCTVPIIKLYILSNNSLLRTRITLSFELHKLVRIYMLQISRRYFITIIEKAAEPRGLSLSNRFYE